MSSGPAYTRLFGSAQELSFESEAVFDNTYAVQRKEEMRGKIYGSVHFLELYNTNTPFEQEAWELIALDEADNLHSFFKKGNYRHPFGTDSFHPAWGWCLFRLWTTV